MNYWIDLELLVEILKFNRRVVESEHFRHMIGQYIQTSDFGQAAQIDKRMIVFIVKEVMPGPECKTDEGLKNHVKDSLNTTFRECVEYRFLSMYFINHGLDTASTLSMLPREMDGVVDPTLRVYGTKNIRVVDLSIAPLHVAAHTQSKP